MKLLFTTHSDFLDHDTGAHHPERPARLDAVLAGLESSGVRDDIVLFEPVSATLDEVRRVHPGPYVADLADLAASGGGHVDADTVLGAGSFDAALLAAGAGLEAVRLLDAGAGDTAFLAIRPPGHHATDRRPMGFCLLNNVSVVAAQLADRGERVLIIDYDAHHGNGTQDIFYADPRVVYLSLHEYPMYPGTGAIHEEGVGAGRGYTVNVPLPSGATGDVYRRAFDEVVGPLADSWKPTWVLVSAGFDAHRRDPLTSLGLTSGDYADLAVAAVELVPAGHALFFLEGGYDLEALRDSVAATFSSLVGGSHRPESATSGGPGHAVIDDVAQRRAEHEWNDI